VRGAGAGGVCGHCGVRVVGVSVGVGGVRAGGEAPVGGAAAVAPEGGALARPSALTSPFTRWAPVI
jgi:hypothetical protein